MCNNCGDCKNKVDQGVPSGYLSKVVQSRSAMNVRRIAADPGTSVPPVVAIAVNTTAVAANNPKPRRLTPSTH